MGGGSQHEVRGCVGLLPMCGRRASDLEANHGIHPNFTTIALIVSPPHPPVQPAAASPCDANASVTSALCPPPFDRPALLHPALPVGAHPAYVTAREAPPQESPARERYAMSVKMACDAHKQCVKLELHQRGFVVMAIWHDNGAC